MGNFIQGMITGALIGLIVGSVLATLAIHDYYRGNVPEIGGLNCGLLWPCE